MGLYFNTRKFETKMCYKPTEQERISNNTYYEFELSLLIPKWACISTQENLKLKCVTNLQSRSIKAYYEFELSLLIPKWACISTQENLKLKFVTNLQNRRDEYFDQS